ncbi:MAG: hypothetical protein M1826_001496 [Phylliscum demangeonii]|nr:MAG: hypothetical protein M1826_001496 [Phylliscum demangeonii]
MASPSIACIGIIGKQNNPLHVSLFAPHTQSTLDFHLLLSSTLDIFDARLQRKSVDQDFGLLHAVDERLACYGWLTNTGVKFVVVVDLAARPPLADAGPGAGAAAGAVGGRAAAAAIVGLRDADLKPAFKALQNAYVGLLQNPFYDPDEHTPLAPNGEYRSGNTRITSRRFLEDVQRIGNSWAPGVTNMY